MAENLLLEAKGITKQFPGVLALDNVDFDLHAGEVHVLIGENGAGKSTLMKIIAGAYQRDGGSMKLSAENVRFHTPQEALQAGISIIYQVLKQRRSRRPGGRQDYPAQNERMLPWLPGLPHHIRHCLQFYKVC